VQLRVVSIMVMTETVLSTGERNIYMANRNGPKARCPQDGRCFRKRLSTFKHLHNLFPDLWWNFHRTFPHATQPFTSSYINIKMTITARSLYSLTFAPFFTEGELSTSLEFKDFQGPLKLNSRTFKDQIRFQWLSSTL